MTGDHDPTSDPLHGRIAAQFSYRGPHADVWRALDRVLATDRYLNLGYSPRYTPTLLGSSQRRLVDHVARRLDAATPRTRDVSLLDVGCGRGGPATRLAATHGFDVTGIDLVAFNVRRAREVAAGDDAQAAFLVGDAARLPFHDGAFEACTAVDSIVYMPQKRAVFAEVSRVLRSDGVAVVTDLVARDDLGADAERAVAAFTDAWDMSAPLALGEYRAAVEDAGLDVEVVEDLSPHSIDRYRRWARLYLGIDRLLEPLVARGLAGFDIDADALTHQIRAAKRAIPSMAHVAIAAVRRG